MTDTSSPRAQDRHLTPRTTIILLAVVAIVAVTALAGVLGEHVRQRTQDREDRARLQSAICDTFSDVASAPITATTTTLGRRLVRDTRHGAQVAECPGAAQLPTPPTDP